MKVRIVLDKGARCPERAHETDAGYDLYAAENKYIGYGGSGVIDTGVHIEIPKGYYGLVAGRSGLNFKSGIICPQGTIDSGYTGSIRVKLYNMTDDAFKVEKGDRIAQIIFHKCESAEFEQVDVLADSDRGSGGFGSTGV